MGQSITRQPLRSAGTRVRLEYLRLESDLRDRSSFGALGVSLGNTIGL